MADRAPTNMEMFGSAGGSLLGGLAGLFMGGPQGYSPQSVPGFQYKPFLSRGRGGVLANLLTADMDATTGRKSDEFRSGLAGIGRSLSRQNQLAQQTYKSQTGRELTPRMIELLNRNAARGLANAETALTGQFGARDFARQQAARSQLGGMIQSDAGMQLQAQLANQQLGMFNAGQQNQSRMYGSQMANLGQAQKFGSLMNLGAAAGGLLGYKFS